MGRDGSAWILTGVKGRYFQSWGPKRVSAGRGRRSWWGGDADGPEREGLAVGQGQRWEGVKARAGGKVGLAGGGACPPHTRW